VKVIVSLCSGQSGINEVEAKPRKWADSWQIVDQAAHGDFVLVEVEDFCKQDLYTNCGYRDRLNGSFISENAKTFTFVRRDPILVFNETDAHESNILSLRLLENLHESNPLKELATDLSDNVNCKLEVKINATLGEYPFVELWVTDVDLYTLQDKFKSLLKWDFLEVENRRTVPIFWTKSNVNVGRVVISQSKKMITNKTAHINLSLITALKYNINDPRALFSRYSKLSGDLSGVTTRSLYPSSFSIDISFWLGENYSYEKFVKCCLEVYRFLLVSVNLIEMYEKPVEGKQCRISHCYRIKIQSTDLALSRTKANEFYIKLRAKVASKLTVELR
jgi:hypothetical protein